MKDNAAIKTALLKREAKLLNGIKTIELSKSELEAELAHVREHLALIARQETARQNPASEIPEDEGARVVAAAK